jgi:hypothetical protein
MLPGAILLVEQRKRNSLSFGSAIKNDGLRRNVRCWRLLFIP